MHNTREQNLDIGRRFANGEISVKEAMELLGRKRNNVYYWKNEYLRSIGEAAKPKAYQPKGASPKDIKDEVADEDEIGQAHDGYDETHLAQFEHTQSFPTRLLYQAVHHQVGTRADERTYTAQDGGIAQGDEKLRR